MFIKSNETSHIKFMILVALNKKSAFITQGTRMTTQSCAWESQKIAILAKDYPSLSSTGKNTL